MRKIFSDFSGKPIRFIISGRELIALYPLSWRVLRLSHSTRNHNASTAVAVFHIYIGDDSLMFALRPVSVTVYYVWPNDNADLSFDALKTSDLLMER